MAETNFIMLDSSLEQVVAIANRWCSSEVMVRNLQKSQKLTKEQLFAWLRVHETMDPKDIPLKNGQFYFMTSSEKLTPAKVLEYAKKNKLPVEVFQRMIDTLIIPKEIRLAWRQDSGGRSKNVI